MVQTVQHLQILPNTFRFYSPLHNLPNTFRIYPPLQNLPTPSESTHHLQNLPTPSLSLYPFSFVTMKVHIKDDNFLTRAFFASDRPLPVCVWPNKSVWGPLDLFFKTFFDICCGVKHVDFYQTELVFKKLLKK